MVADANEIAQALAIIQSTLDKLTSKGHHEAAFEIARAQFAASVRASWPANLAAVSAALDRALGDMTLSLSDDERAALRRAADVLRAVPQP